MRILLVCAFLMFSTFAHAETTSLYAAGSLKAALTEVVEAFENSKAGNVPVETTFGPSGLLRERIEKGEAAHVFASADTNHPRRLADQGRSTGEVRIFVRNRLCALVRPGFSVASERLLDMMLDPQVRLGISTPKADPSGDYAFALFAKADKSRPGARAALESRALQLTGGPTSEKAPPDRNQYAWILEGGKADLFLTYCTNAILAKKELPTLRVVQLPADLNVSADYGMIVLKDAPAVASELAQFVLGEQGQAILTKYGFGRGDPVK
ncbi:MAG: molybdate ABC transporter substrate-binding protein [Hyphomicrobiaceae bacterium]|nr:molybdate ABC transporter substrate-binding protein [Hyphomicrobiaceae bacterium]